MRRTPFTVLPTDLDVLIHVNNGVYLSMMDVARIDLMQRSGLFTPISKKGWYPVVVAQSIRYKRPLLAFQRFVIETRVLGWDDQNITAPDLARALEDTGVAGVFIHGRTREQGFGGTVNLAGIRAVVQAVKTIPVIGNGDVTTPEAAKKMLDETGCAGVSIGRGAFYDPWIFRRTLQCLQSPRSADWQSAVSRIGYPQRLEGFVSQPTTSQRNSRLSTCATAGPGRGRQQRSFARVCVAGQ